MLRFESLNAAHSARPNFGSWQERKAEPGEWDKPDLSLLGSGRTAPPKFPVDVFGDFWAKFVVDQAAAQNAPEDYVAASLFASAAALIGNSREANARGWTEPACLWLAMVGNPGSGKTPALKPITKILNQIEIDALAEAQPEQTAYFEALERAQIEKDRWKQAMKQAVTDGLPPPPMPPEAKEPPLWKPPQITVSDATQEYMGLVLATNPKGCLSFRDELAGWLGSFGRYTGGGDAERTFWLEAWNAGPYKIGRVGRPDVVHIRRLSVSVLGGIQPDRLNTITGGADDGLASRFLWAWPDAKPGFRITQGSHSVRHAEALARLYRLDIARGERNEAEPRPLTLDPAGVEMLEQYGSEMKVRAEKAFGPFIGVLSKAAGQALRLALVLELLEWSATPGKPEPATISAASMAAAIGVMDAYFIPSARRVFGESAVPETDRKAMALIRWLQETGAKRFKAREARRKAGCPVRDPKHMAGACDALIEAALIREVTSKGSVGRPSPEFEVNSRLWGAQ
ncbi:DUF3987 domain-containing protein [Alsobacter soli]|nr:DUF3987 domain-containing protein [Alsobacter soli]